MTNQLQHPLETIELKDLSCVSGNEVRPDGSWTLCSQSPCPRCDGTIWQWHVEDMIEERRQEDERIQREIDELKRIQERREKRKKLFIPWKR